MSKIFVISKRKKVWKCGVCTCRVSSSLLFSSLFLFFTLLAYMGDGSKNEGEVGVLPVRDVLDFVFFGLLYS